MSTFRNVIIILFWVKWMLSVSIVTLRRIFLTTNKLTVVHLKAKLGLIKEMSVVDIAEFLGCK